MEKAMNQGAIDAMAEAVLNPEFQAALDAFEPELDAAEEFAEASELSADLADDEAFDDPEFAALAQEVEAEAEAASVTEPQHRAMIEANGDEPAAMKISPFALLVNPAEAIAAAKHLESLPLPRRVVFLFGKKGITTNPEISRLDQDMDLEADDDLDDEGEEAATEAVTAQ